MREIEKLYVTAEAALVEALRTMTAAGQAGLPAGIVLVGKPNAPLEGILTDGDVRRGLLRGLTLETPVREFMVRDPIVFPDHLTYAEMISKLPAELKQKQRYRGRSLEKLLFVDPQGVVTDVVDFVQYWHQEQPTAHPVAIMGMGYVGLTLAVVMAEAGYSVIGVEKNPAIQARLTKGEPHFTEAGLRPLLRRVVDDGRLKVVASLAETRHSADTYIVTVGTPLGDDQQPYLGDVEEAARSLAKVIKRGDLVILRSTVPVGTSREVVCPLLEESGLQVDRDFFLVFAPERTLEGKALEELRSLPQIVGGHSQPAADKAAAMFRRLTDSVIQMDSLEEAEMVKLVNNCFRDVSFAFANELALICEPFNLDAGRIIRAANEGYSRNPVPMPSPGVGGACLTKDPHLYSSVARKAGFATTLSKIGRQVNERMPEQIARKVLTVLQESGRTPAELKILLVGMAFKGWPETSDLRQSTSLDLLAALRRAGVGSVRVIDPVVKPEDFAPYGVEAFSAPRWREAFAGCDAALFLNNHPLYQKWDIYAVIDDMRRPVVIFDGWQLFDGKDLARLPQVHVLGLGIHHRPRAEGA